MSGSKQFRQGVGDPDKFQSSTYFMVGCTNLPQELIRPLESNCFSRGSVGAVIRKAIATCVFSRTGGGGGGGGLPKS